MPRKRRKVNSRLPYDQSDYPTDVEQTIELDVSTTSPTDNHNNDHLTFYTLNDIPAETRYLEPQPTLFRVPLEAPSQTNKPPLATATA
jgi:hypothetical protein